MARNLEAKCKQCRRAGEKLFLKGERCFSAKCAIVKRNYPPGAHGAKGKRRPTDYGLQLAEKQKAKKIYSLLEKQFKITFEKAKNKKGNAGENFIRLLEMRLDNVVYRLGLATSHDWARQLISHGHIMVNGKKVTIPSCQLKGGDIIKIKEGSKKSKQFIRLEAAFKNAKIPGWLNLDVKELTAKVLHAPTSDDLKIINFNPQIIVEFYSR